MPSESFRSNPNWYPILRKSQKTTFFLMLRYYFFTNWILMLKAPKSSEWVIFSTTSVSNFQRTDRCLSSNFFVFDLFFAIFSANFLQIDVRLFNNRMCFSARSKEIIHLPPSSSRDAGPFVYKADSQFLIGILRKFEDDNNI